MKDGEEIYSTENSNGAIRLNAYKSDGILRAHLRLTIMGESPDIHEPEAKKLHLAIRQWIRHEKSLRGETPRGRRDFKVLPKQYRAPRKAVS